MDLHQIFTLIARYINLAISYRFRYILDNAPTHIRTYSRCTETFITLCSQYRETLQAICTLPERFSSTDYPLKRHVTTRPDAVSRQMDITKSELKNDLLQTAKHFTNEFQRMHRSVCYTHIAFLKNS